MENNFSFFIPIEIIEKADAKKDADGLPEELLIAGIASSSKHGFDKDNQHLNVNGFNYKPLLKSGFINIEHAYARDKDASMIVGEPIDAWVKDDDFHVKSRLFKENPKAVALYKLGQVLKKSGSTRTIGYSLEGKATSFDPADPRKVLTADINHLAITISPKCDGTRMDIIKGGDSYELQAGSEFLIDIMNGEERIVVDKNLNIIKAMDSGSTPGKEFVEKAIVAGTTTGRDTTDKETSGESLKEEDIEASKKKKKKIFNEAEKYGDKKTFSKSETASIFFSIFNGDVESAKRFVGLTERIQRQLTPNMEVTKISKEAIEKAEKALGLTAETVVTPTAEEVKAKQAEELKKAETDKLQGELAETLKKAEDLKAKIEGKPVVEEKKEVIVKAEAIQPIAEFQKANDEKISSLALLIQASRQENEELRKANDGLQKSISNIEKFNVDLGKKIGMIAEQPLERKAITTKSFIEKGGNEGGAPLEKGVVTMSMSNKQHLAAMADVLFKAATAKCADGGPVDAELAKACQFMELGKFPNDQYAKNIQARLLNDHKIKLVN